MSLPLVLVLASPGAKFIIRQYCPNINTIQPKHGESEPSDGFGAFGLIWTSCVALLGERTDKDHYISNIIIAQCAAPRRHGE